MNAGRELDALIGEKIIGFSGMGLTDPSNYKYPDDVWPHIPEFSTDIAAAMTVLDRLGEINSVFGDVDIERDQTAKGVRWKVVIDGIESFADTLPHAICLAALEAVK